MNRKNGTSAILKRTNLKNDKYETGNSKKDKLNRANMKKENDEQDSSEKGYCWKRKTCH